MRRLLSSDYSNTVRSGDRTSIAAVLLARPLQVPVSHVDEVMGNDVRMTWVNNNAAMEGIVHEHDGEGHVDAWGIHWVKAGPYNQIDHFPLKDATPDELRRYRFPVEHRETLLARLEPLLAGRGSIFSAATYRRARSKCGGGCAAGTDGFGNGGRAGADRRDVRPLRRFCRAARRGRVPAVPLGLALDRRRRGQPASLIMSPRTWRELIKPHLARVFAVGKAHGLWVAYHCCGSLRPIIGDLVEMGLDVLNPIQCNCPGMDALELKREFGANLAFMGGVDTQDLLPNGTADEVRRATRRLIDGMTHDGGGYILAASHTIPPETPMENIFAMYAEAGLSREEIFDRAASARAAAPPSC